jgi:hypothetical protein
MIAGNPNCSRKIILLALAALLLILSTAGFFAMRKKTSPEREPPLPEHASLLVVTV